jgi:hypothetical protein
LYDGAGPVTLCPVALSPVLQTGRGGAGRVTVKNKLPSDKQMFLFFSSLLNPSKHNINEICIITFNGALLHVSAPGSHHQAKYNKPILNY